MGPAGIWTALYPPRPSSGPWVRFLTEHHIVFISGFWHTFYLLTVFHLMYCINKVFIFALVFSFWSFIHHFGYYTLVWVGVWIMVLFGYTLRYSDGTCSVQGVEPPHPGHAPPARKAVLPGVLCEHVCSCWSYITVHCWECECFEA